MALNENEIEQRAARARDLFKQGYNCSQSVVGAYADYYGLEMTLALKLAASFGGGIGRMRETCGAACGMFLLAGLETGYANPGDNAGKAANYKTVQELAAQFKQCNGSLICRELLEMRKNQNSQTTEGASGSGVNTMSETISELASTRSMAKTDSAETPFQVAAMSQTPAEVIPAYQPQERTPEYYKKRPCLAMVESGARIFGQFLAKKEEEE